MIRKLQIRFVLMAMTALLLVLATIIAGINIFNFNEVIHDADELLEVLGSNRGKFPEMEIPEEKADKEGHVNRGNKKDFMDRTMSPETPYETRYFSVGISNDTGLVELVETTSISAVDDDVAASYALKALESGNDKGFIEDYRFSRVAGRNRTYIVFVDCGRTMDSARRFLWTSILISLVGYLLVFGIIAISSQRIVRPIARSYEKQRRFITNAGHELKTPLAIISADADVLEMEFGTNEWLADIQKQSKRLSSLTQELVKLARMEEPDVPLIMMDFPISDVVSEVADSFHALAQKQGKELVSKIRPLLSWKGNESAIRQLVIILLDNALKYSPKGSRVDLKLEKEGRNLCLEVSNISENPLPGDDLEQLFERFYRTDPSRSSETGGFGIGLSVAKAIVKSHGGKISATSADGRAISISALLPL